MLILLALQAAVARPATPERFSILASPSAACRALGPAAEGDILVCGKAGERLPLPEERGPPDRPLPSNPDMSGLGALHASSPVCAARQAGCQVGVDVLGMGTAAVRLIQKAIAPDSCCEAPGEATSPIGLAADAVGGVKRLFAKKPDRSNRVAIDLGDPPPPPRATP